MDAVGMIVFKLILVESLLESYKQGFTFCISFLYPITVKSLTLKEYQSLKVLALFFNFSLAHSPATCAFCPLLIRGQFTTLNYNYTYVNVFSSQSAGKIFYICFFSYFFHLCHPGSLRRDAHF